MLGVPVIAGVAVPLSALGEGEGEEDRVELVVSVGALEVLGVAVPAPQLGVLSPAVPLAFTTVGVALALRAAVEVEVGATGVPLVVPVGDCVGATPLPEGLGEGVGVRVVWFTEFVGVRVVQGEAVADGVTLGLTDPPRSSSRALRVGAKAEAEGLSLGVPLGVLAPPPWDAVAAEGGD